MYFLSTDAREFIAAGFRWKRSLFRGYMAALQSGDSACVEFYTFTCSRGFFCHLATIGPPAASLSRIQLLAG
jgi:hypothetical protein